MQATWQQNGSFGFLKDQKAGSEYCILKYEMQPLYTLDEGAHRFITTENSSNKGYASGYSWKKNCIDIYIFVIFFIESHHFSYKSKSFDFSFNFK